jgi:hypothetical protein
MNAKTLKDFVAKISKRSDIDIHSIDIQPPVSEAVLKEYQGEIPADLLQFYAVMNGCHLHASFKYDRNLEVGITIPAIEYLHAFRPADQTNLYLDQKFMALEFEWTEGKYSPFYYVMPEGETDVDKAQIMRLELFPERHMVNAAENLADWMEQAVNGGLTVGWAVSNDAFQKKVAIVKKRLSTEPGHNAINENQFNVDLECHIIAAKNDKKIAKSVLKVPATLKKELHELTRLDDVHEGIESFYRNTADGYGLEWWTNKEKGIGGNLQLAQTKYLFKDPEWLGFYDEDTDEGADIRFFHPFDYPTPESYAGFVMRPAAIHRSVYYLSIGDYELKNLDLDFDGYTQMAAEARAFNHWQVVLLYYMGEISIGASETEKLKTEMPKIFPDWSWDNFITKFESLRLSKPKVLVFYLTEFERTFGKPQMEISKAVYDSPFYIYDKSLKARGPKFPDEKDISDQDCTVGFAILMKIWTEHVAQSTSALFYSIFKKTANPDDTFFVESTYGFAPGYDLDAAIETITRQNFEVVRWDEFWRSELIKPLVEPDTKNDLSFDENFSAPPGAPEPISSIHITKQNYDAILDPLWDASLSGTRLDLLNGPQRNILYIENFENQINSSYIGDVFYNDGGEMAYGVLEALKAIGSEINTKLMHDAIALFPEQPIPDREKCIEIMDELGEEIFDQWQELTTIHRKNAENLFELKTNYILNHPEDFDLSLSVKEEADLRATDSDGNQQYYVLEPEYDSSSIISDDAFEPFAGHLMHAGIHHDFPKIVMSLNCNHFPDSYLSPAGIWLVNKKVRDLLMHFGIDYADYSDVDVRLKSGEVISGDYKVMNLMNPVNIIDHEKSEIEWYDLYPGDAEEDRGMKRVRHLVLDTNKLANDGLFHVDRIYRLVIRGDIAKAISAAKLTGFAFCPVEEYTT